MAKLKITQVKSAIHRPHKQKNTVIALGITRVGMSVVHEATPQIRGMLHKVAHLVEVVEISE